MIKYWTILLITSLIFFTNLSAQYVDGNVMLEGLDTLYLAADQKKLAIDADPKHNPFINKNANTGTVNGMASNDDPGGPGGGGGFGDPPPDVIVPLDGGVSILVVTGAALGFLRRKKKPAPSAPMA